MKAEITHLLEKLTKEHPTFAGIMISKTGSSLVVTQHGTVRSLKSLADLEAYVWPQQDSSPSPSPQSGAGSAPLEEPITSDYSHLVADPQPLTV